MFLPLKKLPSFISTTIFVQQVKLASPAHYGGRIDMKAYLSFDFYLSLEENFGMTLVQCTWLNGDT